MASSVHGTLKAERLDRFAPNVRDCFIYRIRRVDQLQVGIGDHSSLRHCYDEMEQFLPIIGSHDEIH
jgi:hypothetical protein